MKRKMTTLAMVITMGATPVMAAIGQEATGTSMLVILFLGFGALIIACQLIPGLILFGSALKSLFGKAEKSTAEKA